MTKVKDKKIPDRSFYFILFQKLRYYFSQDYFCSPAMRDTSIARCDAHRAEQQIKNR